MTVVAVLRQLDNSSRMAPQGRLLPVISPCNRPALQATLGQEPPFDRYIAGKTLEARFTIVDSRGIQSAFLQEVELLNL